MSLACVGSV
ncbi:hypothetical protein RB213_002595 [Colletotrichum asianum]